MYQKNVLKKIRNAMLDSDLTQESLGKKLGVTQGMISNWLTGYRNPSLASLKKIAKATNKPLNYFLDNSENVQNVGDHNIVVGHNTNGKVVVNEKSVEMLDLKLDLILEKLNNLKK